VICDPTSEAVPHRRALESLQAWSATPAGLLALQVARRVFVDTTPISEASVFTAEELRAAIPADFVALPGSLFARRADWEKGAQALQAELAAKHATSGQPVGEKDLRKAWSQATGWNAGVLGVFLRLLAEKNEIRRQGDGFLPQLAVTLRDPAELARRQKARDWLAKAGGEPGPFREAPPEVKKAARDLARDGEWVALGDEFFWQAPAFASVRARVEGVLREKGQATTSDLKTALGLSRKIAVLLLEQLDRDRVTYLKDGVRRLLRG
jgi:hypothetical protein